MSRQMRSKRNKPQQQLGRIERVFAPQIQDQRVDKVRLVNQGTLTSTAGQNIFDVIPMNPTAANEFATYAALYDEFRVVGIRVSLVSAQQYSLTAINILGAVCFDNDDGASHSSVLQCLEYPTAHVLPSVFQHVNTRENGSLTQDFAWLRPTSGAPIKWCDCAVPAESIGGVKFAFVGVTASTVYFYLNWEYFIEFRGRR